MARCDQRSPACTSPPRASRAARIFRAWSRAPGTGSGTCRPPCDRRRRARDRRAARAACSPRRRCGPAERARSRPDSRLRSLLLRARAPDWPTSSHGSTSWPGRLSTASKPAGSGSSTTTKSRGLGVTIDQIREHEAAGGKRVADCRRWWPEPRQARRSHRAQRLLHEDPGSSGVAGSVARTYLRRVS